MYAAPSGTMATKPVGNPSGTEHSWRMLVMPYLEEKKASEQYRWKKHWHDTTSNSVPPTPADAATGVAMNATNDGECYSFHQGGMVATFGDKSTRLITDAVNLRTFCALVTRAGTEQAGAVP
jgi:hypothetical protein